MYITMTRAAQSACAEQSFALRRIHYNPSVESDRPQRSSDAHGVCVTTVEVRREGRPAGTEDEALGMVLLGIGYETSIA